MKHDLIQSLTVTFIMTAIAFGSPCPVLASSTTVRKASPVTQYVIDPSTLRKLLINDSNSVLSGLNNVYQAKESVNISRGNLLPSISLTGALSAASGFGLSSVTAFLPFLIPSNWANLGQTENQYAAIGASFYMAELNSYASAYALYITILSDQQNLIAAQAQAKIAKQIEDITVVQNQLGSASIGDLRSAQSATLSARTSALRLEQLLDSEISSFRLMLSLPEKPLVFTSVHLPPLPAEKLSLKKVFDATFERSPEVRQIHYLIDSAKQGTVAAEFSFIGSYSVTTPTGDNGFASFSNLRESQHQVSGGIGFGYLPTIRLANLNTDSFNLRLKEIRNEEMSAIETVLPSIASAAQQTQLSLDAEQAGNDALAEQLGLYQQGQVTIQAVKLAASNVINLTTARIAAESNLDNQRLNLQRIMISDQFAMIPKCDIQPEELGPGGPIGALFQLFDGNANKISVDDLCRARKNSPHPLTTTHAAQAHGVTK